MSQLLGGGTKIDIRNGSNADYISARPNEGFYELVGNNATDDLLAEESFYKTVNKVSSDTLTLSEVYGKEINRGDQITLSAVFSAESGGFGDFGFGELGFGGTIENVPA